MARSSTLAVLSALAAGGAAQTSTGQTVWASFAYIMHGERTPLMGSVREVEMLTPQGANQLFDQGKAFWSRYVRAPSTELDTNETTVTTREHIRNLYSIVDDHAQIELLSTDDPWVSASALAFMQGMYPPSDSQQKHPLGGLDIARNTATKDFAQYPMDGYQYPALKTFGIYDAGSVPLSGTVLCNNWRKSAFTDLVKANWGGDKNEGDGTDGFYQQIFRDQAFNGTSTEPLDEDGLNIFNSYLIWDYVRYMHDHNMTVYENLKSDGGSSVEGNGKVAELKRYADEFTFEQNANRDVPIRTIAGKALAQKVLDSFLANRASLGRRTKLTLAFGSYEPIRAMAALVGATGPTHNSTISQDFRDLPEHGAAMVFELVGRTPGTSAYPAREDLKVRFYYRRGTDRLDGFRRYPLFGNEDITEPGVPLARFEKEMGDVAVGTFDWCNQCGSQAPFCQAFRSARVYNPTSKSAVVAGVIGAAVTAAVIGIGLAGLFFLYGMRVHRKGNKGGDKDAAASRTRSKSSSWFGGFGGFKGAEKMASDTDLTISGRGAGHERIGSWELRDGGEAPPGGAGLVKISGMTASTRKLEDEGILEMGMKPVQPRESV